MLNFVHRFVGVVVRADMRIATGQHDQLRGSIVITTVGCLLNYAMGYTDVAHRDMYGSCANLRQIKVRSINADLMRISFYRLQTTFPWIATTFPWIVTTFPWIATTFP